jgi:hypothetical protein
MCVCVVSGDVYIYTFYSIEWPDLQNPHARVRWRSKYVMSRPVLEYQIQGSGLDHPQSIRQSGSTANFFPFSFLFFRQI